MQYHHTPNDANDHLKKIPEENDQLIVTLVRCLVSPDLQHGGNKIYDAQQQPYEGYHLDGYAN
jgi:hypothetical protein